MREGWRTEPLGAVCCYLNRGISPKYLDLGGVCVLNQKCVRDHSVSFESSRRHDPDAKKVSPDRLVQVGDVLVNSTGTGTLGRVAQIREEPREPTTVDSHVTIVRPEPGRFYLNFFGYMLMAIEEAIKEAGEGCGGQTELSRSVLAERFVVSYPESVREQMRIAAILDEAYHEITIAETKAKRNAGNARALFESHLESVFARRREGWSTRPLAELCDPGRIITYGVIKLGEVVSGGVPCLRTSNVRRLRMDTEGLKRIAPELSSQYSRTVLSGGELLVSVRGTLGGVAVVPHQMAGWNISREVAVVPLDQSQVDPEFVAYQIASSTSQHWLGGVKKGAAYVGINLEDLRQLPVSAPEPPEQLRIAGHLDEVLEATRRLESSYERRLADLRELRRSLLREAFSGRLGTQVA